MRRWRLGRIGREGGREGGRERREGRKILEVRFAIASLMTIVGQKTHLPLPPSLPPSLPRYNASALVNKANCVFQRGDPAKAKELYLEALGVEADCLEGMCLSFPPSLPPFFPSSS